MGGSIRERTVFAGLAIIPLHAFGALGVWHYGLATQWSRVSISLFLATQ
jgi:hypothetical protein